MGRLDDMINDIMPNMNREDWNILGSDGKQAVCNHCMKAIAHMDINSILRVFPICSACAEKNPSTGQSIFDDIGTQAGGMFRTESSQTDTESYRKDQSDQIKRREADREATRRTTQNMDATINYLARERAKAREQAAARQARQEAEERRKREQYAWSKKKEQESAYTSSAEECPPYGSFCYELLGISNGRCPPDMQVVKTAYRRKARETHPDTGGNAEEFKIINNAYTTIFDRCSY
jgi:hypothetical protein